MTQSPSFHDAELISAYLDSQLSRKDEERLKLRLKNDPEFRRILAEISQTRDLLAKLPARRAVRNFTLTPKMAGVKPPLPRSLPFFRMASAFAAVMFFFVLAANLSVPALDAMRAAAPAPILGMGGGGGNDSSAVPEAPAFQAAPLAQNTTELTATPPAMSLLRTAPTQSEEAPAEPGAQMKSVPPAQNQTQAAPEMVPVQFPIPVALQLGLLGLAVLSGGTAYFLRSSSERNWFKAQSLQPGKPDLRQVILLILVFLVVIALAVSIIAISSTTFYRPAARVNTFPAGPVAGDKGPIASGDKGSGGQVGVQVFTLTPGLGYDFSTTGESGQIIAVEFPVDVFSSAVLVSYYPGLAGTPPAGTYFANQAFSIFPDEKGARPRAAYKITLGYGDDIATVFDEKNLVLDWWSGTAWQDAAETCTPASSYERDPESGRISLAVCAFGSFVLAIH